MEYTFGEAPLFGQRFGWRYNELVIWGWKKKKTQNLVPLL